MTKFIIGFGMGIGSTILICNYCGIDSTLIMLWSILGMICVISGVIKD